MRGITKGDIRYGSRLFFTGDLGSSTVYYRRLARRGGVKRISGVIYDDIRQAMIDRLKLVSLLTLTCLLAYVLTIGVYRFFMTVLHMSNIQIERVRYKGQRTCGRANLSSPQCSCHRNRCEFPESDLSYLRILTIAGNFCSETSKLSLCVSFPFCWKI